MSTTRPVRSPPSSKPTAAGRYVHSTTRPGRTTSVTDPLGAVTRTAYDAVGGSSSRPIPRGAETHVEYDDRWVGRAGSPTLGAEQRFGYDRAGRRTSATNANGVTTTYAYDAVGNLTTVTEAADAAQLAADSDTHTRRHDTYTYARARPDS